MALPARLFTEVVEDHYRDDRFMGAADIPEHRLGPESMTVPMFTVVDPRAIPPSSIVPFHHRAARNRRCCSRTTAIAAWLCSMLACRVPKRGRSS